MRAKSQCMTVNENTFAVVEASRTGNHLPEELTPPEAQPYRSCSCESTT
jgi:hypothetical protein